MTSITHTIDQDDDIGVWLSFDIEADGSPEDGWTIKSAILMEVAVWLEPKQAEEPQAMCLDKTDWLRRYLVQHELESNRIDRKLSHQWERDQYWLSIKNSKSYQKAIEKGVD